MPIWMETYCRVCPLRPLARLLSSSVLAPDVSSPALTASGSSGAACGSASPVYQRESSAHVSKLRSASEAEAVGGPYLTATCAASDRTLGLAGSSSTRGRSRISHV